VGERQGEETSTKEEEGDGKEEEGLEPFGVEQTAHRVEHVEPPQIEPQMMRGEVVGRKRGIPDMMSGAEKKKEKKKEGKKEEEEGFHSLHDIHCRLPWGKKRNRRINILPSKEEKDGIVVFLSFSFSV
jgi:hypothetical protein